MVVTDYSGYEDMSAHKKIELLGNLEEFGC